MKPVQQVFQELIKSFQITTSQPDFMNCIIIYIVLYIMVIILPIYLYYLSQGMSPLTNDQYAYIYFFMYVMALLLCIVLFLNSEQNKKLYFGLSMALIAIIGVLIYYYSNSTGFVHKYAFYFTVLFYVVTSFIVIVALALTYSIFENNLRNQTGVIGFLIDLIFYLPCLFIDFIGFLGREFRMTPNIIFILFILEILLILAYIYIPNLIKNAIQMNMIQLFPDATNLNASQQIATALDLAPIVTTDPNTYLDIKTPRQNYTISMWIYLNQQLHNKATQTTTNIFSYGSQNNYKPNISYFNMSNESNTKDIYQITFTGSPNSDSITSYNLELNSQKWNQLVFNYKSTYVDLYVNGILERTFYFQDGNIPNYSLTDTITVGEDNGLNGAICNIKYYMIPLTDYQIVNSYNLLATMNPPMDL